MQLPLALQDESVGRFLPDLPEVTSCLLPLGPSAVAWALRLLTSDNKTALHTIVEDWKQNVTSLGAEAEDFVSMMSMSYVPSVVSTRSEQP